MRPRSPLALLLLGLLVTAPLLASAQSDEFDDVLEAPTPLPESPADATAPAAGKVVTPSPVKAKPSAAVAPPPAKATKKEATAAKAVTPVSPPAPAPVATLSVPVLGAGDLDAAWESWRTAAAAGDNVTADKAFAQLLRLKEDFAIASLDMYAAAMARAADQRREADDTARALVLAENAVALAPLLPSARWTFARSLVSEDPSAIGQALGEAFSGIRLSLADPRFARPLIADVSAVLLVSLLATCAAVVLLLFARRLRYAFHDFHHLFPRAAATWQSATVGLLLLSLPLVFRWGFVPLLLVLFAAVAFHLSRTERLVAGGLLALTALVPLLAGPLAAQTIFAGSADEDLYLVARGGPEADPAAARIELRRAEQKARFEELFALAHLHQRRGRLAEAIAVYKEAAILKTEDPLLSNNLGVALHASGDLPGAEAMYEAAKAKDDLPAPYLNLAVLHQSRSKTLEGDLAYQEQSRGEKAAEAALARDPSLADRMARMKQGGTMNRVLLTLPHLPSPLAGSAASISAERVQAQLGLLISGGAEPSRLALLVALIAGAVGLGALSPRLKASRACERCGRAACRRCDPEVGVGGAMCAQCVNVFAKKLHVHPQLKVRKHAEVASHRWMQGRVSSVLGMLCSGAGHLFLGAPLVGTAFLFFFFFAITGLGLREGLVRVPFGGTPLFWKLAPLLVMLMSVYALAYVSLRKRQARES